MIVAIIQTRMDSTRLPGKVMLPVKGKPLIYYVINQLRTCKKLSKIVIATTDEKNDDVIVDYAKSLTVDIFRGNSEDVLDRYYKCAKFTNAKIIVRVTSDCPLIDPCIVDTCINKFQTENFDYLSNTCKKIDGKWIHHPNGFPSGLGVEVFSFDTLERAWSNAKKPSEREHVTPYILNNPDSFHIGFIENSTDLSGLRLTVDHMVDYELIKTIIEAFQENEVFTMDKITNFLNQNPQLKQINDNIQFNEGYLKSIKEDEIAQGKSKDSKE